jgi:hypothetical protein
MATGGNVLGMLIPSGGWVITADDFESIRYDEGVTPITKKQFTDGFAQYDAWKSSQDEAQITAKATAEGKLAALGLTTDDLRALGL